MAKNNSLTYIKKFIEQNYPNCKKSVSISSASTYYEIDGVDIRLSDHDKWNKTSCNGDIYIVKPLNDDKHYMVTLKKNVGIMIMDLKQVKSFIENYVLIHKMDEFSAKNKPQTSVGKTVMEEFDRPSKKLSEMDSITIGQYFKENIDGYSRVPSQKRRLLRRFAVNEIGVTDGMQRFFDFVNGGFCPWFFAHVGVDNAGFLENLNRLWLKFNDKK